jgi:hypothetical protein
MQSVKKGVHALARFALLRSENPVEIFGNKVNCDKEA